MHLQQGPANNSKVWSNGTVAGPYPTGSSWANVFDGDLGTGMTQVGPDANAHSQYLTLNNPIPVNGQTVEYYADGIIGGGGLTLNDSVTQELSNFGGWTTVNGFSDPTITQLKAFPARGETFELKAIKVGGVLVVDGGAQWDTSKIWSKGVTSGRPLNIGTEAQMFDGVLPVTSGDWTNWYVSGYQNQDPAQSIKYTFETPHPVTENSTFRAWCYNGGGPWSAVINGTPTLITDAAANGGAPTKTLTRLSLIHI